VIVAAGAGWSFCERGVALCLESTEPASRGHLSRRHEDESEIHSCRAGTWGDLSDRLDGSHCRRSAGFRTATDRTAFTYYPGFLEFAGNRQGQNASAGASAGSDTVAPSIRRKTFK